LDYVLEDLPRELRDCRAVCDNVNKTINGINATNKELQENNIGLELKKLSKEYFFEWQDKTEGFLESLQEKYHNMQMKRDKLENWIDIYMPLKL